MAPKPTEIEAGPAILEVKSPIPGKMEKAARKFMPQQMADFVFGEVIYQLQEGDAPKGRAPMRGHTYGGGENITRAFTSPMQDTYPDDEFGFSTIDLMLKTGTVRFALELKKAAVLSALFNELQWQIQCKDEKLSEIVKADMQRIFATYGAEMLCMLEYGAFFGELIWEYAPASMRGLEGEDKWWILEGINTVKPETVDHINRVREGKNRGRFDGFVQKANLPWPEHTVPVDQALILTFRKKWRNLWGESILKAAYPLWYWFDIILASFIRYLGRSGVPLVVCTAPMKGRMKMGDGKWMGTMDYALLVATEATRSEAVALPSDLNPDTNQPLFTLSYLTDDKRVDQYLGALQFMVDLLTRSIIMGAMADFSKEGGGFNREEAHWGMTQLDNQQILSEMVSQLTRYHLPKYAAYNASRGTYIGMELVGLDPNRIDRVFKFLSTAGNQAEGDALNWPDWQLIFQLSGIPTVSEEEVEKLKKEREQKALEMQKMMKEKKTEKEGPPREGEEGEGEEEKKARKEALEEVLLEVLIGNSPILLSTDQIETFARNNPDLFHDDTEVHLYNPYHDELGRFASKAGAAMVVGASRAAVETFGDPKWVAAAAIVHSGRAREILRSPEEKARIEKETNRALGAIPKDLRREDIKVRHHAGIGTYVSNAASVASLGQTDPLVAMSAGFVTALGSKTVNISPMIVRAMSSKNAMQRAFARHCVIHESIHARKRSGYGQYFQRIPLLGAISCRANMPLEEGMTDLLASMASGTAGAQPYSKYRDRVAKISMAASGGDKERAVQWIKDKHYRTAGPFDMASDLRAAGYDASGWDVFNYAHTGRGKLTTSIGKPKGYGNRFTKSTRRYEGYFEHDTNARRIATGTTEAMAAWYYKNKIYTAIAGGMEDAWRAWQSAEVAALEEEILLQDMGDPGDWDLDLSAMILSIGDGMAEIIDSMPEEDREDALLFLGLGYDSIPWSAPRKEAGRLEEDNADFFLFNPYHDEKGRFTDKARAATESHEVAAMRGVKYGPITGRTIDKKKFEKTHGRISKELSGRLPGCEETAPVRVQDIPGVGVYYGAYWMGDVYISSTAAHAATQKKPGMGHHTLIHELTHGRKRTNLKGYPRGDWQEEGATELISRKLYRDIYGQSSPSNCYNRYTERIGRAAWQHSNGDSQKAWQYVDDLHNKEIKYKKATNGAGWEAMLGAEYKFEEEENDLMDQLLDLIEQKKWDEARAFVEEHPDPSLIFVFGEAWIQEFGIEKTELESDEEIFELFNPYHDELGRFTSKERGGALTREPKYGRAPDVERKYELKDFVAASEYQSKELEKRLPGCSNPPDINVANLPAKFAGAYVNSKSHYIILPPDIARDFAKKKGGFAHHSVLHERVHARKRTNTTYEKSNKQRWLEEGCTEILARRLYKDIYGKSSPSNAYGIEVQRVAAAAWEHSDKNADFAWRYVDDVHNGRKKFKDAVYYDEAWEKAMFDGKELKLEEAIDLQARLSKLIEQKKWKEADELIDRHPDPSLILMYGEAWVAEHGIGEEE